MRDVTASQKPIWVRSKEGLVAGVCEGLANSFHINEWLVRIVFVISGAGLLFYLVLAIALPREDRVEAAMRPQLLGVCWNLSQTSGTEVGLIRALTLSLALITLGGALFLYMGLYLIFLGKD